MNDLTIKSLKQALRLYNTDLRWYRDKYLMIVSTVCLIGALVTVKTWPPNHGEWISLGEYLAVAAVCFLLTPNRLIMLLEALGFIAIRGIFGLIVCHSIPALSVAVVAVAVLYFIIVLLNRKGVTLSPGYTVGEYSYGELAIDLAVLLFLLWLYLELQAWAISRHSF
jgi:hypothetical protein